MIQRPGDTGPTIARLAGEVNAWAAAVLDGHAPGRLGPKVVRDPIHDFVRVEAHEVGLCDTPIVQRLRYIHQTAFAFLVYPGLRHTRFEHSIGVLHVANRMLSALERRGPVDPLDRLHVRLAALLHDVGHVAFSHLGEIALERSDPHQWRTIAAEPHAGTPRYSDVLMAGWATALTVARAAA